VDERALAQALKKKIIAGAALDVFERGAFAAGFARCSIPRLPTARGCFHHFASGAQITRLSVDPDKGMGWTHGPGGDRCFRR
jgi:hypothetical protein